jgi:hypothetical protein
MRRDSGKGKFEKNYHVPQFAVLNKSIGIMKCAVTQGIPLDAFLQKENSKKLPCPPVSCYQQVHRHHEMRRDSVNANRRFFTIVFPGLEAGLAPNGPGKRMAPHSGRRADSSNVR